MVTLVAFPVSSIGGLEPPLWWCCDMLACDKACLFFASSMEKKTSWVVQCWEATTQETNISQYKYTYYTHLLSYSTAPLTSCSFENPSCSKSERKVEGQVSGWSKRKRLLPCFISSGDVRSLSLPWTLVDDPFDIANIPETAPCIYGGHPWIPWGNSNIPGGCPDNNGREIKLRRWILPCPRKDDSSKPLHVHNYIPASLLDIHRHGPMGKFLVAVAERIAWMC